MIRTRTVLLTALLVAMPSTAGPSASTGSRHAELCATAFYEALDAGEIDSVNGLAIEQGFAGFFFTGFHEGRARILERRCVDGRLDNARPVFPPNIYSDYQPTLSPDGNRLYFTSTRPIDGKDPVRQNVWIVTRSAEWRDAAPIAMLVSPYWDGHAVEIAPRTVLFASERPDDGQMVDIFEFNPTGDGASLVRISSLNTEMSDNDMAFDRHSRALVFARYDPHTEDIDLFISFLAAGDWSHAELLSKWATPEWEMSPAFTPDGQYLLYKTRNEPFLRVPMSDVISSVRSADDEGR